MSIFDAQAAEAKRRKDEFRLVLEEITQYARNRKHRPTRAAADLAADAAPPLWATNAAFQELTDLEQWYAVDHAGWDQGVAWLVELAGDDDVAFYRPGTFGFRLWRCASRESVYRLAAVEFLPEIARRLIPIATSAREGVVQQLLRGLPGGHTPHELLAGIGVHLSADGSFIDGLQRWFVAFWHATDADLLVSFAALEAAARAAPGGLFAWSCYEVAHWLAACHREGRRDVAHITSVLDLGGWAAELGNYEEMHAKVRAAIADEEWRRQETPRSLFDR